MLKTSAWRAERNARARAVDHILANGPRAMADTKALVLHAAFGDFDEATFDRLIESHAAKRQSDEAVEGLASFREKRPARWK